MTSKSPQKKHPTKRTVSIPQAVVLAALSASVGVISTALVFAHFLLGSNYDADESIFSVSSPRYARTIHSRGGLLSASSQAAKNLQSLLAPSTAVEDTGPWPKVVWLMSFPNR